MTTLLPLPANHIHIWLTSTDEAREPALLARYDALISADERLQAARFHFPEDAHRYLITRALVRTVLSRYAALEPVQWIFEKNAYGKPSIANPQAMAEGLHFNVSHTQGLIALVVSRGAAVGVDLEHRTARADLMELAQATMTRWEWDALHPLPAKDRETRFYQHWTLKEAYIKARGRGLDIPLTQVGFEILSADRIAMHLDPALGDAPGHWNLWHLQPTDAHCMALCAARHGAVQQQLSWWRTVPLQSERALQKASA